MNEAEFHTRAEATLAAIERAIEAVEIDADAERQGGVLTLELADGSKIVVNIQAPMQQIWVAARSGGYHYGLREGSWIDTRDGAELFATLSRIVSQQGGQPLMLAPRR
jgi:CyaY protein